MTDYTDDIKRYLNGTMSAAERHAFEKKVLDDPFLADALEGAEQLPADDFAADVNALNEKLLQPGEEQTAAVFPAAGSRKAAVENKTLTIQKKNYPAIAGRIAAGVALLLASGYILWRVMGVADHAEEIALEKAEPAPMTADEMFTTDSIGEPGDKKPTELSATQPSPAAAAPAEKKLPAQASRPVATDEQPLAAIAENKTVDHAVAAETKTDEVAAEQELPRAARQTDVQKKTAIPPQLSAKPEIATNTIRGRVTFADDGSALPGVNVLIKGTTIGTVTDANGNYRIDYAGSNPTLVFNVIGFQSAEVPAGDQQQVDVSMRADVMQLSEVVVTGYGIAREGNVAPTVNLAHPEIGLKTYRQYLENNVRYPEQAKADKIQGRVTVEFFVETDGQLTGFTVIRGIGYGCDEELIRLIKQGPKWIPTQKDNVPVRDKARVRLKFELPK